MSSGNHYILYFTRREYLKSSGFGQFAVENSRRPYSMRERAIYAQPSLRSGPSPETMPLPGRGQGAAMVHLLWRGVEGVDKRSIACREDAGASAGKGVCYPTEPILTVWAWATTPSSRPSASAENSFSIEVSTASSPAEMLGSDSICSGSNGIAAFLGLQRDKARPAQPEPASQVLMH
jgi:hypothetical protein